MVINVTPNTGGDLDDIAVAGETTAIYYWALWDFLGEQADVTRVLYNPRTTEHMGEVLSKKVRNELVDALLLAEQLRLGSAPEVLLQKETDLLTARYYSQAARDLAQQINRRKNQLRALLRAYCAPLFQVFPGSKLHYPAVYALLQESLFPDELVRTGDEALAATLAAHCRDAFGLAEAQQLVEASRRAITRPIGRDAIRCLVQAHIADIITFQQRKARYPKAGYALIKNRPETKLLRTVKGAGVSNPLALVSEIGGVQCFSSGDHLASFLWYPSQAASAALAIWMGFQVRGLPAAHTASGQCKPWPESTDRRWHGKWRAEVWRG